MIAREAVRGGVEFEGQRYPFDREAESRLPLVRY
jgi:hypothetical protein